MGSEGYEYKDSLIVLIARLNFDVDAVPFHMAENLIKLTKAIEEDVWGLTQLFVDLDQDDEIDLADVQLIDEEYTPSDSEDAPE